MPEVKDWITYGLTVMNIIVTVILSYMVWKVTKKATDIAQESFNLTEIVESRRLAEERSMRRRILRNVIKSVENIHEAIDIVAHGNFKYWGIHHADDGLKVSEEDLAKYLTREEIDLVDRVWANFRIHKLNHWTNSDGSTKRQHTREVAEDIKNSAKLIEPILWESLEALRERYKQV